MKSHKKAPQSGCKFDKLGRSNYQRQHHLPLRPYWTLVGAPVSNFNFEVFTNFQHFSFRGTLARRQLEGIFPVAKLWRRNHFPFLELEISRRAFSWVWIIYWCKTQMQDLPLGKRIWQGVVVGGRVNNTWGFDSTIARCENVRSATIATRGRRTAANIVSRPPSKRCARENWPNITKKKKEEFKEERCAVETSPVSKVCNSNLTHLSWSTKLFLCSQHSSQETECVL